MTVSLVVRKAFAGFTVDLAAELPPGLTVVFGPSGSGKSTVINMIAGLVRPDAGHVSVAGRTLFSKDHRIDVPVHRRKVGVVFQDARLFPHLDVRDNLLYGATPGGRARLDAMADLLGLTPLLARRTGGLSGGERQRVAIGRALLSEPDILLMDEPLASLDEARKAEILPHLERLRDEKRIPIIYVTHSAAEAVRLADTILLLDRGRAKALGPVAEILSGLETATALGHRETGVIIPATVEAHEGDSLTRLRISGGALLLPAVDAGIGTALRLRLLAQDVMLATERPVGISALNVLDTTVEAIRSGDGPGALISLSCGTDRLLARVTRRSVETLGLAPGKPVHAVLKAVSVAKANIGKAASDKTLFS